MTGLCYNTIMKKQIVLIASLVAGVIAAVLTRFYLAAKDAEVAAFKQKITSKYGTMSAVVFKHEVPSGTVLTSADLGALIVPKAGLNGQAVPEEEWQSVIGRKLIFGHKKGEVLFWSDIEGGDPSVKGLSADIKRQMRAVSINCTGAAAVSSMVKPNDHVDVIGTFDFEGAVGKKNFVTCTILQNVLVLATGNETAKTRGKNLGFSSGYSTVTLEVTPREAEMLAFAEQIKGRLVLTLRNRNDTSFEKELPKVDFEKIRAEIEELNLQRQQQKLSQGH